MATPSQEIEGKSSLDPRTCIIAVLGAPASGKGTLCKRLTTSSQFLPTCHLSVGDLLRNLSPASSSISAHLAQGTVLPASEIVPIISQKIATLRDTNPHTYPTPIISSTRKFTNILLLDGFPRNSEQEHLARTQLARTPDSEFPHLVVYFSCEKQELKRRYVERRRGEDDATLFEKRYEQHERECPAVVELYRARGILVEVDTQGGREEAYWRLVEVLRGCFLGRELVAG